MNLPNDPKVLLDTSRNADGRVLSPDRDQAWRWIGWFSLVLTIAGFGDWLLAWIPFRLGTPEWEFGTVAATFAGLPLVTMGLAGLLASSVARGIRWQLVSIAVVVLLFAALIAAAFVVFLLDVPLALGSVQGSVPRVGILKATAKTVFLGALFFVAYAVAGIGALRLAFKRAS